MQPILLTFQRANTRSPSRHHNVNGFHTIFFVNDPVNTRHGNSTITMLTIRRRILIRRRVGRNRYLKRRRSSRRRPRNTERRALKRPGKNFRRWPLRAYEDRQYSRVTSHRSTSGFVHGPTPAGHQSLNNNTVQGRRMTRTPGNLSMAQLK